MSRKITSEERNILLENPELVMFNPYSALKTHYCSLGKALILPLFTALTFLLWSFLCPDYINSHPRLFAGAGCAALVIEDPECRIAHVQWIVYEKAEGGWILDGKEEMFGYASYVNCFRIEPDTDLAVISDGEKFWAFISRDVRTERFYQRKS